MCYVVCLVHSRASGESVMTQSNGETRVQRGRAQQLRDGLTARSQQARAAVRNVKADDVKGFFQRNAFVVFTVAAVIIGEMMCGNQNRRFNDAVSLYYNTNCFI